MGNSHLVSHLLLQVAAGKGLAATFLRIAPFLKAFAPYLKV
jgi:hypothetical protein